MIEKLSLETLSGRETTEEPGWKPISSDARLPEANSVTTSSVATSFSSTTRVTNQSSTVRRWAFPKGK